MEGMSAKAKQTAVNQAAQISMNRGQFQPFYYYTANNTNGVNGQTVQLHGWPQMQGMPQVFPQFAAYGGAVNFNQFYAQAMQQQLQQQHQPINNTKKEVKGKKEVEINPSKKMVTIQSSNNSETDSLGLRSKTESESNGTHSCDLDKSQSELNNNTKQQKKKQKNRKPVKKVIVIDLPEDLQTIESVTNKCQQYGEILLVRVLKPGKILPFDLKMYSGKIHDLGQTCCAIIEFESSQAASATVDAEENNLRCALLQPGADIALYGNQDGKATSEHSGHSSEHTHGESGIGKCSNRDSLSHHSHDDLEAHNDFVEDIKPTKPIVQKAELTFKPVPAHNNFRPSFLKNKPLLATPPKEFQLPVEPVIEQQPIIKQHITLDQQATLVPTEPKELKKQESVIHKKQESKVIASTNGRITTALNIKLCASKPSINNRNVIKMDLTNSRFTNCKASDLLPNLPSTGRTSPALLSDPSDDMLMVARFSEDNDIVEPEVRSYNRDLLFSLRECKRALEIPTGLPNIPELMPNRW